MLIACERLAPWRGLATLSVALVLTALTIGVAVAPSHVPLLTIPGSPTAMRAMGMTPARSRMPAPASMAPSTKPMSR